MRTYENFQRYYQLQMGKNQQCLTEIHKENQKLKKKWDKGDIGGREDLPSDCTWRVFENIMAGADPFGARTKIALCGYGERPLHTFFTIVVSTLFFAVLYFFGGIDDNGCVINYSIAKLGDADILQIMRDYGHCIFFSVATFSTVGYGNYVPLGACSSLFAAVHMFMGVGLCTLWTGCIFRKLSR